MGFNESHQTIKAEKERKLTIFIVDNQSLYRQAIRSTLDEHIDVVGESPLTVDVLSNIESIPPDIVLVDVGLPLLTGFGVARQISKRCPTVDIVMISASPDDDQMFRAVKSGAVAFLSKDISADEMAKILIKIGHGEYPINDSLVNGRTTAYKITRLFQNISKSGKDVDALLTPLSPREMEILKYIAEGNSNKRIAHALGIGEQTTKNYIASIMRKLNASDRTHAVVLAMQRGWLNIGEIPNPQTEETTPRVSS